VRTLRYVLCDVFTDRPLEGNPVCVFTDARGLDPATMQALAREFNLSETVFVSSPGRGGHARLHVFGPRLELAFGGHPVLGAAFVLGGPLQSDDVQLEVEAGLVRVRLEREAARISFGWMSQPTLRSSVPPASGNVLAALGIDVPGVAFESFDTGAARLCVTLPSAELVHGLRPDFSALAHATECGIGVFHAAGERCVARYFAPARGVNEDAATGSFAGILAFTLFQRGRLQPGQVLCIAQGEHIGRPSTLYARIDASAPEPAIEVGGAARIVGRGEFVI
jgi:trans-2,3-dihydro-3-hydroxyanthranilate isomerase